MARKAKRWDEKHMSQLKAQKEKLTEELRDAMKKSRKESELNTIDSQIRGLETRLKYAKSDMESTVSLELKSIVLLGTMLQINFLVSEQANQASRRRVDEAVGRDE